ncbi:sensor histidine kinase [Plantactinospora sp. CA-290183]|uniref:sensor histidine kinase n=1 Tax=Plantactinospora sp. CA-290183 TaxID=3240006 RepID=UPI003D93C193
MRGSRTVWWEAGTALLVAGTVWVAADIAVEPASAPPGSAGWTLGAVLGGLHLARRRFPVAALAASVAAVVVYHSVGVPAIGLDWPLLIPYLAAAASGHVRTAAVLAVVLGAGAVIWRTLVERETPFLVTVGELQSLAVVGLALAVGEAAWQRRRWAAEVQARLARAADDARREADRQMAEQRLAVAADLHDVAAHSLVVIGLQLRLAEETVTADPAACQRAVAAALAAHDEALRETATTVRLLRANRADGVPPRSPVPGLADLYRLRETAAAADVELEVRVSATAPVPAATALIAYRICQEALTNTIRHAGARRAVLRVETSGEELRLSFRDDGADRPAETVAPAGNGLAGMAERARSLGGRLRAGPAPDRGFLVEAWLPTPGTAG